MRLLRWIAAGVLLGVIVSRLRRFVADGRLEGTETTATIEPGGPEPVLGYDGMDQETLLEWLDDAALDDPTIREVIRYEAAHLQREPVLAALEELLG